MDLTTPISAILFDKDGTLFEFAATWNNWAANVIDELSEGNSGQRAALAQAVRFELAGGCFRPDSPVIAGTNRQAAECLASALPGRSLEEIEHVLTRAACDVPLAEAVPLVPLLTRLRASGLRLGLATNDTEQTARAHLDTVQATAYFDFVAGFDSGYGAKPEPGPLLAFAGAMQLAPAQIAMVGDSTHDLIAARRAGMVGVGVLTGTAPATDLAPFADVVLPDIGHLPHWLANW